MAKIAIDEKGCRGCQLCVDTCPVEVFTYDTGKELAKVSTEENCISCLSCFYICPSQCLTITDYEKVLPYHRVEESVEFVEKFLQEKTATNTISKDECAAAFKDVSLRLNALSQAVTDTMGRGSNVVGRKAGSLAAEHMPEMYEGKGLEEILKRLQTRFRGSFEFDFKVTGEGAEFNFHPCGLHPVVESLGQKVGESPICHLFHEYWAGLLGAFVSKKCQCKVPVAGAKCEMKATLTE